MKKQNHNGSSKAINKHGSAENTTNQTISQKETVKFMELASRSVF